MNLINYIMSEFKNLLNDIVSVYSKFWITCLIAAIFLVALIVIKFVTHFLIKKDKVKCGSEKINKWTYWIINIGIVLLIASVAYTIYHLWEEVTVAFTNAYLTYTLLFTSVIIGILWWLIILMFPKKDRIVTPIRILFGGIFIAAVVFFYPLCREYIIINNEAADGGYWFSSLWAAMQFAFRLFILDGELFWIFDLTNEIGAPISILADPAIKDFYTRVGSVLYVSAPILTFGFVLTFFKNIFAKFTYALLFVFPTHIFSELNEKSLALAADIKKRKLFSLIVFTDITDKVIEDNMELVEDARMLGAIMFNKDFDSIKFRGLLPRKLFFYLISEDEPKKLRHAKVVMENYDRKYVELRLFSPDIRSELLIASLNPKRMRAIRIDDIQTLVYHNLYTHGKMLFERARTVEGEKDKVISAVIVGLGQYGKEMLKALTWFCQLKGYKIKITAFDSDEKAEEKFKFMCPELMHENYNCQKINGEPYYEISIIGGIDVTTPDFRKHLERITDATYIFVCLGNDDINLKTSADIRSLCETIDYVDNGRKPDIETVIYDSRLASAIRTTWEALAANEIKGVTKSDSKKRPGAYNLLVTGDLDSFYSVSTLIDSKLIDAGFKIHFKYAMQFASKESEESFIAIIAKRIFKKKTKQESNDNCKKCDKKMNRGEAASKRKSFKKNEKVCDNKQGAVKDLCLSCRCKYHRKRRRIKPQAERTFWRFEYNYNSSIARAIHRQLRIDMGQYPDIDNWDELTHEQKVDVANPEHIRWSAYMRTKGYSKGDRNDLGKRHNNLVPTAELNDNDLEKD